MWYFDTLSLLMKPTTTVSKEKRPVHINIWFHNIFKSFNQFEINWRNLARGQLPDTLKISKMVFNIINWWELITVDQSPQKNVLFVHSPCRWWWRHWVGGGRPTASRAHSNSTGGLHSTQQVTLASASSRHHRPDNTHRLLSSNFYVR